MYSSLPNLIIGFHGCDESVYDKVICQNKSLAPSNNEYDWLGNGIYFWEQNLKRAWEWAEQHSKRSKTGLKPAVIGAVIDLGYCLNLLDGDKILLLKQHYDIFKASMNLLDVDIRKMKMLARIQIGFSGNLIVL